MEQKELLILVFSACSTIFVFCISLIILFIMLQKRRLAYHEEIVKTRIEIKEQTLKNISWEIHDNIGQILSTLVLYNHTLENNLPEEHKHKVLESRELIENAIREVRALSKATNTDYIKTVGLLESVKLELERFQRLKFLKINLIINGNPYRLNEENGLILLRILQEFFANTIKHSKASTLEVIFQYKLSELKIIAKDNGIGVQEGAKTGRGIINMQNRAILIGAFFNFDSGPSGTTLEITYPHKLTQHESRKNSNS